MSEDVTDSGADLEQQQAAEGSVPPEAMAPAPEPEVQRPSAEPQAGSKKKRKIDLKARLSSVRAAGSMTGAKGPSSDRRSSADPLSFPPPAVGSVPAPKLPGISAPAISSPFAPEPEKPKPTAQQQTIKVEMGEEVQQERKRTQKKMLIYVALAAVVALALGFITGGARERGQQGFKALQGANALATDIEAANKSMIALSDALRDAVEKLGNEEFPDDLADVLAKSNVPFSAANFQGKGVGGLPGDTLTALLTYTSGVQDLNDQKDKLRNLLGAAKPAVEKFVKEKNNPVVNFSVVFEKQGANVVGQLVPNKEPFSQKDKWPDKYTVLMPAGKGKSKDVEATRYDKGEVVKGGDEVLAIPMDEQTVAQFTSHQLVFQLRKAIADIKNLIDGVQSPDPRQQTDGLLKEGDRLIQQLKKVAAAG